MYDKKNRSKYFVLGSYRFKTSTCLNYFGKVNVDFFASECSNFDEDDTIFCI